MSLRGWSPWGQKAGLGSEAEEVVLEMTFFNSFVAFSNVEKKERF